MNDKKGYSLFTAKDIERLLCINSKQLFHWVQNKGLLKPTVQGIGRGKSNYFSLEDMATLLLIKILYNRKIDLWEIKNILEMVVSPNPTIVYEVELFNNELLFYDKDKEMIPLGSEPINIWQAYKKEKEKLDKAGFVLYVRKQLYELWEETKKWPKEISMIIGTSKIDLFPEEEEEIIKLTEMDYYVVNLLAIIKNVEEKTGLAL